VSHGHVTPLNHAIFTSNSIFGRRRNSMIRQNLGREEENLWNVMCGFQAPALQFFATLLKDFDKKLAVIAFYKLPLSNLS